MDFFIIDCRGTHVKIPIEIAKKVEIFRISIDVKWKDAQEPFYVNHSSSVVHEFVNHISGFRNINFNKIEQMCSDISYIQYIDIESVSFTVAELYKHICSNFVIPLEIGSPNKKYQIQLELDRYLTKLSHDKGYHLFSLKTHQKEDYYSKPIKGIEIDPNEKVIIHSYLKDDAQFYLDKTIWFTYIYTDKTTLSRGNIISVYIKGTTYRISAIKKYHA